VTENKVTHAKARAGGSRVIDESGSSSK